MEQRNNLIEKTVYQLSIKWYKEWKTSPEYDTLEEAMAAMSKFVAAFDGRFLNVTIVKGKRSVTAQ